jgi:hypothetical protein
VCFDRNNNGTYIGDFIVPLKSISFYFNFELRKIAKVQFSYCYVEWSRPTFNNGKYYYYDFKLLEIYKLDFFYGKHPHIII